MLFVLAGGKGSRLREAIGNTPKALASVNGIPFLELQILNWTQQGVSSFTFLIHHGAEYIIDFLKSVQDSGKVVFNFNYVIESQPLDTAGAVANALLELNYKGDFLLTNADTWINTGLQKMLTSHPPSMAVVYHPDAARFGSVSFDETRKVNNFFEKTGIHKPAWVNAGLWKFSSQQFKTWTGKPYSLERDLLPKLIKTKELTAVSLNAEFVDIGIPSDYRNFCHKHKIEMVDLFNGS